MNTIDITTGGTVYQGREMIGRIEEAAEGLQIFLTGAAEVQAVVKSWADAERWFQGRQA